MECKYCSVSCTKAGKQQDVTQRYYCKQSKKYQQRSYKYRAYAVDLKIFIPKLIKNSVGIRGIARVPDISIATVTKYIASIAKAVVKPLIPLNKPSVEIDEIRIYIGSKENQYWIAYAMCSKTKEVLDYTCAAPMRYC